MHSESHSSSVNYDNTVAVIGMACSFPRAPDLETFWHNIIHKIDAVTDAPPERWDTGRFYDPAFKDRDKIYAQRGGYLESPFCFNAAEFGIMPKAINGGEPDQFLVLKTAADAMRHAGLTPGGPGHENTAFILGRGSYLSAGAFNLLQRTFIVDQTVKLVEQLHPDLPAGAGNELRASLLASLKPFEAETAPSVMPNISAGRTANRLGLMGPNYIIDAACASSLFAVDAAVSALLSGRSDLALAGGVHIFNNIPFLNVFCTLGAMSRREQIRPFDAEADGMLPGEGVGIVVLKRTVDAQKDGDRIYAVIRGVGTSSDGRGISVAAPRVEGEVLALERAYQSAGVSPGTIGLIEAHGTATRVGDAAEIRSLAAVFGEKADGAARHCALGAVKSMIGHAMPAAGIASLIKTVLALHHKILPPTLNCDTPNPKFELEKTPFYVNTETRPWLRMAGDIPRRAGVNAFGFGGVNAHVVLEEYPESREHTPASKPDAALFLFSDVSRAGIVAVCREVLAALGQQSDLDFTALSQKLLRDYSPKAQRLAVIAESGADLARKLEYAITRLQAPGCNKIKDIKGIYYFARPLGKTGKTAFMFPGEGAAYTGMMMDLCLRFPAVRNAFDEMNTAIAGRNKKCRFLPGQFIFPATLLTEAEYQSLAAEFWKVDSGLQAILASSMAMNDLLQQFGVAPDMIVGHSAGEYGAWIASGILDKRDLYQCQEQIVAIYDDRGNVPDTAMVAVSAGINKVRPILENISGNIHLSNDNCPHQVVAVGETGAMDRFRWALKEARLLYTDLPSREVHHTPMAAHQAGPLAAAFSALRIDSARIPVYSSVTAAPYPGERKAIVELMVRYWLRQLRFRETVEAMYRDGARIFIEVGPGNNLCGFVDDTLRGKSVVTVPVNTSRRSGNLQLCHLLGMLAAQHVDLRLDLLIDDRQSAIPGRSAAPAEQAAAGKAAVVKMDLGLPELYWDEPFPATVAEKTTPPDGTLQTGPVDAESRPTPLPATVPNKQNHQKDQPKTRTMEKYLNTMSRFLDLQKEMVLAVHRRRGPHGEQNTVPPPWPMADRMTVFEPGVRLEIQRHIRLDHDIFLLDHPFGGDVSRFDNRLNPLIVTPLTINLEMMVEAAAMLFPGKVPVGIRDVRANRWIEVDEETGVRLAATARLIRENEAVVRLYDRGAGDSPSAEARIHFDGAYPEAIPAEPAPAEPATPEALALSDEMYTRKLMTHGRRFQVVTGLTRTARNEIVAFLRAPDNHDLYAAFNRRPFLINPLLLDACAQITGYWAQATLSERFITFPVGAMEITFFSGPPPPGDRPRCRMRIRDISRQLVRSDLTVFNGDGQAWVRVTGWTHRRFDLPDELYRFYRFPGQHTVGRISRERTPAAGNITCAASCYNRLDNTIWQKAIGYLYLNADERRMFREKLRGNDRPGRWLSGRIAAKDALRVFLREIRGELPAPADITLVDDRHGNLMPRSRLIAGLEQQVALSVIHADDFATAHVLPIKQSRKQEVGKNEQTG